MNKEELINKNILLKMRNKKSRLDTDTNQAVH